MKAWVINRLFMKNSLPTWMLFFTPVFWTFYFGFCATVLYWFPEIKNFVSSSILVYTAIILIIWVLYAMPYCSKHVILVICWLIFGTLIIAFTFSFLLLMLLVGVWNIKMGGIAYVLIIFGIMVFCSVFFIFANKNKDKMFLDRVKVSIYISALIFSISISISNMYSINITDFHQIPLPFKINPSSLEKIGFNPRNFASYMLAQLTFPFLSLNVFLRALIEWINYQSKKRDMKGKSI